jgi:hypothetical protein
MPASQYPNNWTVFDAVAGMISFPLTAQTPGHIANCKEPAD